MPPANENDERATAIMSEPAPTSPIPRSAGTGTTATRWIGIAAIVMVGWLVAFGLGFSPADRDQEEAVRILYVHVPTVWLAYLAFVVTAVCSGLYLFTKKHSLGFDRFAGASAEIGVVFMALTLISRHALGRITWGVFWQWDARLTTTALLFVSYIGYLAVRNLGGSPPRSRQAQRDHRSADRARDPARPLLGAPVAQPAPGATVANPNGDVKMDGLMLFSLFVGVIAFSLIYLWLLLHRSRALAMEDVLDDVGLDRALAARRAGGLDMTATILALMDDAGFIIGST
jgi:heme exporter protein C